MVLRKTYVKLNNIIITNYRYVMCGVKKAGLCKGCRYKKTGLRYRLIRYLNIPHNAS